MPLELVAGRIRCSRTPGYSSFSYPYQLVIHHTFLPSAPSDITPSDITHKFASSHAIYNRHVQPVMYGLYTGMGVVTAPSCSQPAPQYPNWRLCFWTITVQQLDGTKTSIKLSYINRPPIYKLRELVKEVLSIPTHQQKLALGAGNNNVIVLEDWDEEGGAMAIAHYPSLHDGAALY